MAQQAENRIGPNLKGRFYVIWVPAFAGMSGV